VTQLLNPPGTGKPLALPGALMLVAGVGLIYYALRGWDNKYGTFGGAFNSGQGKLAPSGGTTTTGGSPGGIVTNPSGNPAGNRGIM
jgi:hypothetical protein